MVIGTIWMPRASACGTQLSNAAKVELMTKLRMVFEACKTRVPISRVIREDLHSIQRVVSAQGNITYRAPHTEDGHADRATAKALAEKARTRLGGGIWCAIV